MDELLMSRVKQLKEIDERLERMVTADSVGRRSGLFIAEAIIQLRRDVQDMVRAAEAEHAAF